MGNVRTITRDGADLLAQPPSNVQQPRRQSHTQRWTKAHTADAWVWRAPAAVVADVAEDPIT